MCLIPTQIETLIISMRHVRTGQCHYLVPWKCKHASYYEKFHEAIFELVRMFVPNISNATLYA